ncbi:hypothetical protein BGZ91_004265, partial [Linnemannia elongata]
MSAHMRWGSHIGWLCVADLSFKGAVGLSPIYCKLLVQRVATDESLSSREEGSSRGAV